MSGNEMFLTPRIIILFVLSVMLLSPSCRVLQAGQVSVSYSYDRLNRLTGSETDCGVFLYNSIYIYDALGNIIQHAVTKQINTSSGDLNGDGEVNLTDVIVGLQILSGKAVSGNISTTVDFNGDGKLGIPETINAMSIISKNALD